MIHLSGHITNLETIAVLSRPYLDFLPNTSLDLKTGYRRFLTALQPIPQSELSVHGNSHCAPRFVTEESLTAILMQNYRTKSRLNDLDQGSLIERSAPEQMQLVRAAYQALPRIAPVTYELFNLTVNFVFCGHSDRAGGGSTSGAIGVIWANPRPSWSHNDFFEFFAHELTHQLLFLDERRFRHYRDYFLLEKPENFACSAILRRPRPLDKVVHSLVVSTEVLAFREQVLGHPINPKVHPPSELLISQALACIDSLRAIPLLDRLLEERAHYWITLCEATIHRIQNTRNRRTTPCLA